MRPTVRRISGTLVFVGSLCLFAMFSSYAKAQYSIVTTDKLVYGGATRLSCTSTACTSTVPMVVQDGDTTTRSIYRAGTPATGFSVDATPGVAMGSSVSSNLSIYGGYLEFTGANGLYAHNYGATSYFSFVPEAADVAQIGYDAATAAAQTISAADSTGANQPGGQLNLSGGVGGAGGEPGAVAIVDGGTKPTCAVGIRGSIWYDAGGAGAADTFEVCAKNSSNVYAWIVLATIG